MNIAYIKALHIIFVVTWYAGLFYIVRLFIYQTEANQKEEPERSILIQQFRIMQKRLWYGITWPSAILAPAFGFWMYFYNFSYYFTQPWMHLKLIFIVGLFLYQIRCQFIFDNLKKEIYKQSSFSLRIWNEVATLFLVAIVFLVVLKSSGSFVWSMLGFFLFAAVLMSAIYLYKKIRSENQTKDANQTDKTETKK